MTVVTETTSPTHRPGVILSPNHILEVCKAPVDVSLQTSNAPLPTSHLCQRPNGDQPLSADPAIQAPTISNPSPFDTWEPILTYLGIKWVPTIAGRRNRTCPDCPVCDECSNDVDAGDFAWCEDVSPADYQLTTPHHTAHSTYQTHKGPS